MKIYKVVVSVLCAVVFAGFLPGLASAQSQRRSEREGTVENDPLEQPLPRGIRVRAFIHRPRVVEPNHLGTCDPITTDSSNYGLTGWHLPSSITWKLNASTVPESIGASDAFTVFTKAFDTWHAADSGKVFVYGGTTTAKNARFDGVNAVFWGRLSPWTIGVTYVWYYTSTGLVAEVDTVFNKRYPWAIFPDGAECQSSPDAYDLQDIATHEFGHWIGLDDLYNTADTDLTMYGFGAGGELKKRTLGTGDFNGAANVVAP